LARPDGAAILGLARPSPRTCAWSARGRLERIQRPPYTAAARVGGLDLGFVPRKNGLDVEGILNAATAGDINVVYLLGADEIDMRRLGNAFVVYQGHHGDAGAARADVILPGAAYTEKNGTYVNTEGRVQNGRLAVYPPGEAREDWKILRALSDVLGRPLPYNTLGELRARLIKANPVFARVDAVQPAAWGEFGGDGLVERAPFISPIDNFYLTDPISRASLTMARCSEIFITGELGKTGTDA